MCYKNHEFKKPIPQLIVANVLPRYPKVHNFCP